MSTYLLCVVAGDIVKANNKSLLTNLYLKFLIIFSIKQSRQSRVYTIFLIFLQEENYYAKAG